MTTKSVIAKIAQVMRLVLLSLLFGGSIGIIFAAVTLVTAARAQGVSASAAATANAPIFIQFSTVLFTCGLLLVVAEAMDYASTTRLTRLSIARYVSSILCAATTAVFTFCFVLPMKPLLPVLKIDQAAHHQFRQLHESSRAIFGGTILLALFSLLLPVFDNAAEPKQD